MRLLAGAALVMCLSGQVASAQTPVPAAAAAAQPCAWQPPATSTTIRVRSVAELHRAVAGARRNTTILIEPGDYRLDRMVVVSSPDIVLRGSTGRVADVVLHGDSMRERQIGVALSIDVSDVTVADLTIRDVGFHAIQVRGEAGASRLLVHNVRLADTGQQLLKGSTNNGRLRSEDVVIACSTLEYTDHAPSNYTNGVDVLAGTNWTVRDNRLLRIRGPASEGFAAGPAILFWANSSGTRVERNIVIDCFRGISLGLMPGASGRVGPDGQPELDHDGGRIRNNVVVNLHSWADEGIELNAARAAVIDHNTVLTHGSLPWAISLRFPHTTASVRNNLLSKPLGYRDGGQGVVAGNVSGAAADWFVDVATANLRLARANLSAVDAGVPLPEVSMDAVGERREAGAPDAGAFEFVKAPGGSPSLPTIPEK